MCSLTISNLGFQLEYGHTLSLQKLQSNPLVNCTFDLSHSPMASTTTLVTHHSPQHLLVGQMCPGRLHRLWLCIINKNSKITTKLSFSPLKRWTFRNRGQTRPQDALNTAWSLSMTNTSTQPARTRCVIPAASRNARSSRRRSGLSIRAGASPAAFACGRIPPNAVILTVGAGNAPL